MKCPICLDEIDVGSKMAWSVERIPGKTVVDDKLVVDPNPYHKDCISQCVGQRGALGNKIFGYKIALTKPDTGGIIYTV